MEGENLKLALREVGKLIRKNLKQSAKDDKFSASGNLDKSFKYRVEKNELYIFGEQYANALSGGINKKGKYSRDMADKLAKWKSLGFVLAASIAGRSFAGEDAKNPNGGISKRFEYKGSGFIEAVQKETKEQIKKMLKDAYKKDILEQLNTLKAIK